MNYAEDDLFEDLK